MVSETENPTTMGTTKAAKRQSVLPWWQEVVAHTTSWHLPVYVRSATYQSVLPPWLLMVARPDELAPTEQQDEQAPGAVVVV